MTLPALVGWSERPQNQIAGKGATGVVYVTYRQGTARSTSGILGTHLSEELGTEAVGLCLVHLSFFELCLLSNSAKSIQAHFHAQPPVPISHTLGL